MNQPISPIEIDESLIGNYKEEIAFIIPGKPFAKQRPRTARRGSFTTIYTPKETVNYEKLVKRSYQNSLFSDIKLEGPIEANITALFSLPKSLSKKKQKELLEQKYYTKKPDCDNIDKVVLDGLNEIAYDDDSQICKLNSEKRYQLVPMTMVSLRKIT